MWRRVLCLGAGLVLAWLALLPCAHGQTPNQGKTKPESWRDLAHDYLAKGDYDNCISNCLKAIHLNPRDAWAYETRALARGDKGDLDGAIADFRTALRINPDYAYAYDNCGWFLQYRKHDLRVAIADYSEAIRLEPTDADYYVNRAGVEKRTAKSAGRNRNKNRKEEFPGRALADYQEAAALDCHYLNRMAFLEGQEGHYEQGIADFTKYIQAYPTNISGWDFRAFAYERAAVDDDQRGDLAAKTNALDKALADWDHLVSMEAHTATFVCFRGDFYARNNQFAKALNEYQKALELQPTNNTYANFSLGWFLATCPDPAFRNGTNAVAAFHKALGTNLVTDSFDPAGMAAANAEAGDFERAVEFQKQALTASETEGDSEAYRADMKERLTLYEQGKPCHRPLGVDPFD